jgi:hypothetical protein
MNNSRWTMDDGQPERSGRDKNRWQIKCDHWKPGDCPNRTNRTMSGFEPRLGCETLRPDSEADVKARLVPGPMLEIPFDSFPPVLYTISVMKTSVIAVSVHHHHHHCAVRETLGG